MRLPDGELIGAVDQIDDAVDAIRDHHEKEDRRRNMSRLNTLLLKR